MAAPKTRKHERERIKAEIARLRIQGKTLPEIGALLGGYSKQAISYHWRKIEDGWKQSAQADIALYKGRQLDEITVLREEAWEAWKRSQRDAEASGSKLVRDADGTAKGKKRGASGRQESFMRKEGQVGDPRFLQIIDDVARREARLLGLDAPQKIAPTDPTGDKEYGFARLLKEIWEENGTGNSRDDDSSLRKGNDGQSV